MMTEEQDAPLMEIDEDAFYGAAHGPRVLAILRAGEERDQ